MLKCIGVFLDTLTKGRYDPMKKDLITCSSKENVIGFSIRVVDSDGQPRKSARVGARSINILGGAKSEYTDDDGWANFDWPLPETVIISVDGDDQGEHPLDDGDTLSFTT